MSTREQTASYEVGTQAGMHPDDQPSTTSDHPKVRTVLRGVATPIGLPAASRQGDRMIRPLSDDEDTGVDRGYDDASSHPSRSTQRYLQPRTVIRVTHHRAVPPRAHAMQQLAAPSRQKQHAHTDRELRPPWVGFIGLALIVMVIGWIALSLLFSWWQRVQDEWHYGYPRTSQVDALVGGDSAAMPTHFVATNVHGHISIIEMHASDPNHVSVLVDPTTASDLDPVILQFKDVNHDGMLDMVVLVHHSAAVFINDGHGTFRPATHNDTISL